MLKHNETIGLDRKKPFICNHNSWHLSLFLLSCRHQWRTQKLFAGGADEWFNHIFRGCDRVSYLKNTLNFFFKGCARPP
ncbi:hypothetical protein Hanom_Chr05g00464971 [Helianthus anomalus]